jgi:hypothetical protein
MTDLVTGLRAILSRRMRPPLRHAWTIWAAINKWEGSPPNSSRLKSDTGSRDQASFKKATPTKKVVLLQERPPGLVHRWQAKPRVPQRPRAPPR